MDTDVIAVAVVVAVAAGLIAGSVAYTRSGGSGGAFLGYFVIGVLIPIVGIVLACLVQRPAAPPQPPGWYPDPWGSAPWRWWDGAAWSYHTSPGT